MRIYLGLLAVCVLCGALTALAFVGGSASGQEEEPQFTSDFRLAHCGKLVPNGANDYFSLRPGRFLKFEGEDEDGGFIELTVVALKQTRKLTFEVGGHTIKVTTRVILESEWIDGEIHEVSHNYYARCKQTGDIYYFGEEVDFYENGEITNHEGSWLAGEDGAIPGLFMPELFLLGARYVQEIAPEVAMDRAEHVEMGLTVDTPAGVFEGCVKVLETTPLEPGAESIKIYAPGVGLIFDNGLELVEYGNHFQKKDHGDNDEEDDEDD